MNPKKDEWNELQKLQTTLSQIVKQVAQARRNVLYFWEKTNKQTRKHKNKEETACHYMLHW